MIFLFLLATLLIIQHFLERVNKYRNLLFSLSILIILIQFIIEFNENKQQQSIATAINNLDKQNLKISEENINDFKGFSIYFIGEFEDRNNDERQFLFDIGESDLNNRFSLYLDKRQNLVFRIIDGIGETHSYIINKKDYLFYEKIPFLVYIELGVTNNYSFVRLYLNNKLINNSFINSTEGIVDVKYLNNYQSLIIGLRKVDLGINTTSLYDENIVGTLGANMNGNYISKVFPFELVVFGGLMLTENREKIWKGFQNDIEYFKSVKKILKPFNDEKYYKLSKSGFEVVK